MMDAVFIIGNHTIINYLIRPLNRLFNLNIKPIHTKKTTFIQVQMLYALACVFLGICPVFSRAGSEHALIVFAYFRHDGDDLRLADSGICWLFLPWADLACGKAPCFSC